MTLIRPHESWGCLVTLEMETAQPPSVLALPGAWPLEVGSGTALASWAAVAQWRFCSVHASANQLDPIAMAIWWSFSRDRKSTRLNSSHVSISYAVFC